MFNLGECYYHYGDFGQAIELLKVVLQINKVDPDAENILNKIRSQYPSEVVDFRKDGAILDANFVINFCNTDYRHFPRFLKKARKRYNLYSSDVVFAEILYVNGNDLSYPIDEVRKFLEDTLIVLPVHPPEIFNLETQLLSDFIEAEEIKARHMERVHAWLNDLSLICLLYHIQNPIKYIVTNDLGITQIIKYLHPDKDPHYYLRPNELFTTTVNNFCQTATRALWERQIYGKN